MKRILIVKVCVLFSCVLFSAYSYASSPKAENKLFGLNQNLPVGIKTSDTSATVSISVSQIQTQIVSKIKSLQSAIVISSGVSILVGQKNYLLFNVAQVSDTLQVAVELEVQSGNLVYSTNKQHAVHICLKTGNCNSCMYVRNKLDRIIGCSCEEVPMEDSWDCKHRYEKSKN